MPRIIGLILLIMGCVFAAAGLTAGTLPWLKMMQHYWQARSYVPVQAQVLDVKLTQHPKGMRSVQTRYQYLYQNNTFVSARIGLGKEGADNLDDWQEDWVARLKQAKEQNQTLTAWVNPEQPQEAVLDRSMRWSKFVFLIPFAVLLPLVGIALILAGLFSLMGNLSWVNKFSGRNSASNVAQSFPPSHSISAGSSSTGLWLFATFWNLLSWPIAAVFWMKPGDISFVHFFVAIFPAVGSFLIWASLKVTRLQRRQKHLQLTITPSKARLGEPVQVHVMFDEAMTRKAEQAAHQQYQLRLLCMAEDLSRSGATPRELWGERAELSLQGLGMQASLQYRFMPPPGLPASGVRSNDGETVSWHIELFNKHNGELMNWDIVLAASLTPPKVSAVADRFEQAVRTLLLRMEREQYLHELQTGQHSALVTMPESIVSTVLTHEDSSYRFPRRGWRVIAMIMLGASIWFAWLARSEIMASGFAALNYAAFALISLALAWHWASTRWILRIRAGGIYLDRGSLFRRNEVFFPHTALSNVYLKYIYDARRGADMARHYSLNIASANNSNELLAMTPAVAHQAHAEQLVHHLWQAQGHAQQAFSAPGAVQGGQPFRQTALYRGLMLMGVAASLVLILQFISTGLLSKRFVPEDMLQLAKMQQGWALRLHDFTPQGRANNKLFDAQSRGDIEAAKQALKDGADASAKAAEGYTVLMFAARRGQTDIVTALLKAGADVNAKDEISTTNAGDTALLAAAYGGHIEVLKLLLDAGATLTDKNMWDWNAMHMAAQSSCVPCLELLHGKGVPLNEKAMKSRGETPLMLAAAKNRVEAMQWLMNHGADLHERDPYGYDALGWAEFYKANAQTKSWIKERL